MMWTIFSMTLLQPKGQRKFSVSVLIYLLLANKFKKSIYTACKLYTHTHTHNYIPSCSMWRIGSRTSLWIPKPTDAQVSYIKCTVSPPYPQFQPTRVPFAISWIHGCHRCWGLSGLPVSFPQHLPVSHVSLCLALGHLLPETYGVQSPLQNVGNSMASQMPPTIHSKNLIVYIMSF